MVEPHLRRDGVLEANGLDHHAAAQWGRGRFALGGKEKDHSQNVPLRFRLKQLAFLPMMLLQRRGGCCGGGGEEEQNPRKRQSRPKPHLTIASFIYKL